MPERFTVDTLLHAFEPVLEQLPDHRAGRNTTYTISDAVLSAFAVFFMQAPFFLAQQHVVQRQHGRNNAQTLFGVTQIPSDNQIRNLLDPLPLERLFPLFETRWQILKATGTLTAFQVLNQQYLIALDGTQYFSSRNVHCDACTHTTSATGITTYSHTVLPPMLVAPQQPHAVVLAPEFITPQDGHDKQDCEHAAAKRWLAQHAPAFSPQSVTLLGDDLYSHQPFCELALAQQCNFILVCKPDSRGTVYNWVNTLAALGGVSGLTQRHWNGRFGEVSTYRYVNNVPLRAEADPLHVNWCELTITDVAGVRVGHTTLISGKGALRPGVGPVRTGVTVILPHDGNLFRSKVGAAVQTINGYGKVIGFEQVRELGVLAAPLALTNTLNVGLVADALVQDALRQNPDIGITTSSVNVVVGKTNDGYLNDLQGRHVRPEHVFAALTSASDGAVLEGAVGAGTGTMCFGRKGGVGTASRVLPIELGGFTLGALVQSNFGRPRDLLIAGVPIGRSLQQPAANNKINDKVSIMIVVATDAPLEARQIQRLCVRAGAELARVGSYYGHGSGDFVVGFSTANRIEHEPIGVTGTRAVLIDEAQVIDGLFRAVVEAVEEAIVNSLFGAETIVGRDGHVASALSVDEMLAICNQATFGRRP